MKLLTTVAGFGLLLLAVIGIILPIMPGLPFAFLGLALLSREYHWAKRLEKWSKKKAHTASVRAQAFADKKVSLKAKGPDFEGMAD